MSSTQNSPLLEMDVILGAILERGRACVHQFNVAKDKIVIALRSDASEQPHHTSAGQSRGNSSAAMGRTIGHATLEAIAASDGVGRRPTAEQIIQAIASLPRDGSTAHTESSGSDPETLEALASIDEAAFGATIHVRGRIVEQEDQGSSFGASSSAAAVGLSTLAAIAAIDAEQEPDAALLGNRFSSAGARHAVGQSTLAAIAAIDEADLRAAVKEIDDAEEAALDRECIVCLDCNSNVVLTPCRHSNLCADCARALNPAVCPTCRADIDGINVIEWGRTLS